MKAASWRGIAITRLIPGLRIYTTLVAGAARVPRRTFLAGMLPATVVWVVVFVILGALVGLPVEHFFNQIARLAVQGVILIAMGVGVYIAIRKTPSSTGAGLVRVPKAVRIARAGFPGKRLTHGHSRYFQSRFSHVAKSASHA